MTSSLRLCKHQVQKHLINDFVRQISKTSSVCNVESISRIDNDAVTDKQEKKLFKFKRYKRSLSTQTRLAVFESNPEKLKDFMAVFPDIVHDLTENKKHTDIPEINKWFAKALQYNVPFGKKNRAVELAMVYKMLEKPENLTKENMNLAYILGWCCEMFQATFIMSHDIVYSSQNRRGVPCWYKLENVGLSAISDIFMIENGLYQILKKYFKNHMSYIAVIELFHDMALKTAMGQCLDVYCHRGGRPNLDLFTMERYSTIAKYKTSYYTFKMPVTLAMYLAGIYNPELHRQAKHILLEIGHFLQVQKDFLNCFGDPDIIGNESTDIQEGKCTWLAVVALQRLTHQQRALFEKCYGNSDTESIETVKDIYEQLGLPNTYAVYEEKSFNLTRTHIQQMSGGLPHKLFFTILEMVYGRRKTF